MMAKRGFYVMVRGWLNHPTYARGPYDERSAWAWLIEHAAFRQREAAANGNTVLLERGQLAYSIRYLADRWQWSIGKVRRFLKRLERDGLITLETGTPSDSPTGTPSGTPPNLISICNYDRYQGLAVLAGTPSDSPTGTPSGTNKKEGFKKEGIKEAPVGGQQPRLIPDAQTSQAILFGECLAYLRENTPGPDGKRKDKNLRSLLGKWRKSHGDEAAVEAITQARLRGASDPIQYVQAIFRNRDAAADIGIMC